MSSVSKDLVNWAVQTLVALGIVVCVYYIASYATVADNVLTVVAGADKVIGPVVNGLVANNTVFTTDSTLTASGRTIVPLPPSNNQDGGVQFSYSFWIQLPPTSNGPFKRVVLFRGDPTTVPMTCDLDNSMFNLPVAFCPMIIVSCQPRVTGGVPDPNNNDVTVSCHVNTYNERNVSASQTILNGQSAVNMTQWNLITVTVKDAFAYGSTQPSSMSMSVWINQVEAQTVASINTGGVLLNTGNLYLMPTHPFGSIGNSWASSSGTAPDLQMKNLIYANYAMSADEIYNKISAEADQQAVPYKLQVNTGGTTSSTQAYWDISMNNLSVPN